MARDRGPGPSPADPGPVGSSTASAAPSPADPDGPTRDAPEDAATWDAVYEREGRDRPTWSGRPNGPLVAEVSDLPPGRALDVGCGEGADAAWLAERGWQVIALDPSAVALARARDAAAAAGVEVEWLHGGLLDPPRELGEHDLVTAHYPVLRHEGGRAVRALLAAVAPGGTLLFVHHDPTASRGDPDHPHEHGGHDSGHHGPDHHGSDRDRGPDSEDDRGPVADVVPDAGHDFDPADHLMPDDVAAALDDTWTVLVHEHRPRGPDLPAEARHVEDAVLHAVRRSPRPAA